MEHASLSLLYYVEMKAAGTQTSPAGSGTQTSPAGSTFMMIITVVVVYISEVINPNSRKPALVLSLLIKVCC